MSLLAGFTALIAACGGEEGTCQTSVDCALGETCNIGTNLCEADPQADTCTRPGTCPGGQICNVATGECGFSLSCSTTNAQPDACAYGQFCSTSNCAEVPVPASSCTNFAGTGHTVTWGTGKTGPVIYELTPQATVAGGTFCGSGFRYRVDVKAYWGADVFPGDDRTLEGNLHLVGPDGVEIPAANTVQNVTTTNSGKNVTFTVNYCRNVNATYSAGMHFTDGNEVCIALPAQ
ncbi:MAG: hypothetical protein M3Y59_02030 [Myxococcota bacterium]|nr:hypothetical protein [Myxococcota bacterium]